MLHDLRHAVRGLLKSPGFASVLILTLALGIGANTAVLTLAKAVFFNPLPFKDPDQLVAIGERRPSSREANIPISGHEFAAWREQSHGFEEMALYQPAAFTLTGGSEPEAVQAIEVSANYLSMLGLYPAVGRWFVDDERRVAVLSDRLWHRRFGADPGAIGRTITLNDDPYVVVGVLRPLPESLIPDLVLPMDTADAIRAVGRHNLTSIARLRSGTTLASAQADLDGIADRLARELPRENTGHGVAVTPLREEMVGEYRSASWMIVAGRWLRPADRLCQRRICSWCAAQTGGVRSRSAQRSAPAAPGWCSNS